MRVRAQRCAHPFAELHLCTRREQKGGRRQHPSPRASACPTFTQWRRGENGAATGSVIPGMQAQGRRAPNQGRHWIDLRPTRFSLAGSNTESERERDAHERVVWVCHQNPYLLNRRPDSTGLSLAPPSAPASQRPPHAGPTFVPRTIRGSTSRLWSGKVEKSQCLMACFPNAVNRLRVRSNVS